MDKRPEYLEPVICGKSYVYGEDRSASALFVLSLTMHIDRNELCRALNEAMVRYPQFAVGLDRKGESVVFRPLSEAVTVYDERDLPSSFSSESTGGYLFCVSVSHKTIFFRYHRTLTDEYGAISFLKAVLVRYLELAGYQTDEMSSFSGEYIKAEGMDPMERLEDMTAIRPGWYMDAKAASYPEADGSEETVVQVRIPLVKMGKEFNMIDKTPVTYIAPIFSHCVYERIQDHMTPGEYVVAAIQINLRPYFPTASMRPFHTPVFLAYNRVLGDYPYNTVLMSQKKLLEAQLRTDALAYSAQRKMTDIEKACIGDYERKCEKFADLNRKTSSMSTYTVCRIGNVMVPDQLQRYITEFYPVIPASTQAFSLTVMNYRGEMNVTISGRRDVKEVCRSFVEQLNSYGIGSFIADEFVYVPMMTDR